MAAIPFLSIPFPVRQYSHCSLMAAEDTAHISRDSNTVSFLLFLDAQFHWHTRLLSFLNFDRKFFGGPVKIYAQNYLQTPAE